MPIVTAMLHPTRARLLRGADERAASGTINFCSWQRLSEELKRAGCLMSNEEIEAFVIEDAGITLHLRVR